MFDKTTGQVFTEWTVPREALSGQHELLDWSRKPPKRPYVRARNIVGPRSLVEMSIHILVLNIGQVSEAHLAALPVPIKRHVWLVCQQQYVSKNKPQ